MYRVVFKLMVLGFLLTSNIALSQHFITGWKTGLNVSRLSVKTSSEIINDDISENNESQIGVEFGVFKVIPLNEKWSVHTNVTYQLRRQEVYERKRYFSYLNINPNIQYHISDDFTVFTGLNAGLLLNALEIYETPKSLHDNPSGNLGMMTVERNINKYLTTVDLQWSAGMEVKFNEYFGIEMRGALSLLDLNAKYGNEPGVEYVKLKFYMLSLSTNFYLK